MPFKPGQSGNPAGRKRGCRNRNFELLRSNDERLQKKVLKMALDGDAMAIRICADRLWPKIRQEAAPVRVDANSAKLSDKGLSIVDATLSGELGPDTARELLSALADLARLNELTEIEERLQALEGMKQAPPWEKKPLDEKLPIRGKRRRLQ